MGAVQLAILTCCCSLPGSSIRWPNFGPQEADQGVGHVAIAATYAHGAKIILALFGEFEAISNCY